MEVVKIGDSFQRLKRKRDCSESRYDLALGKGYKVRVESLVLPEPLIVITEEDEEKDPEWGSDKSEECEGGVEESMYDETNQHSEKEQGDLVGRRGRSLRRGPMDKFLSRAHAPARKKGRTSLVREAEESDIRGMMARLEGVRLHSMDHAMASAMDQCNGRTTKLVGNRRTRKRKSHPLQETPTPDWISIPEPGRSRLDGLGDRKGVG